MFRKRNILSILLLAAITIGMVSNADAGLGLKYNWIEVVDEFGIQKSTDLIITIQTTAGATATVYKHGYHVSTETMATDGLTNPFYIGDAKNGVIAFYYSEDFDLKLSDASGNYIIHEDLTSNDHKVVFILRSSLVMGTLTLSTKLTVNEEIEVNLDATDEEIEITSTVGSTTGRGVFRVIITTTSPATQHYGIEIWQKSQGDADADFFVCYASTTKEIKFVIDDQGRIIGDDGEMLDLGCATDGTIIMGDGSNAGLTLVDAGSTFDATISGNLVVSGKTLTLGASETIAYDSSSYEFDVSTTVNMNAEPILNIGNAGTDFSSAGGLTLAADLDVLGNNINDAGGSGITFDGSGKITGAADIQATGDLIAAGNDVYIGTTEKLTYDGSSKITISTLAVFADGADSNNKPIINIGAAGTDFSATGGLTTAVGIIATTGDIQASAGDLIALGNDVQIGASEKITYTSYTLQFSTCVDLNSQTLINIGASGTDFSNSGGLTTAVGITATTGDIEASAGDLIALGNDVQIGASEKLTYDGSSKITISTDTTVAGNLVVDNDALLSGNATVVGALLESVTTLTITEFNAGTLDKHTLTVAECGYVIVQNTQAVTLDLPAAAAGLHYTIVKDTMTTVEAVAAVTIDPDASETIGDGASTSNNDLDNWFDVMILFADDTEWYITHQIKN